MSELSAIELTIYAFMWVGSVLYSMYQFHLASDKYSVDLSEDLVISSWKWVGRKADTADYEWKMWNPMFLNWLKYVSTYLIISLAIKKKYPNTVKMSTIISFVWLWKMLGLQLTILIYIQPLLFYWIAKLFSLTIVWIVCIGITFILQSSFFYHLTECLYEEHSNQEYLFSVLVSWTHARSISYLCDTRSVLSGEQHHTLMNCYDYCFYLPLLPSGPLMLYREFEQSLKNPQIQEQTWTRLLKSAGSIARYLFWWFFHQLALHYFYHSALQYNPTIVERLEIWPAAGLGYTLGQFFMTKYFVFYGLPSALAKLDLIDSPPPPKCVGRIHLYSQMWRDFDRGLYSFMLNYIYIPCKRSSNLIWSKLARTALCFGFVCVWHGATIAVVVWCLSNYIGICLETTAKYCSTLRPFADWKANWSTSNWIRFQAAAASPLLLMSALSNFCFFTNANVGYLLARKAVYEGGIVRLFCILVFMYCCCHTSMALGRRNKRNAKLAHPYLNPHEE